MANIFLVDDSPEILEAMEYILHDLYGYEVKTASSSRMLLENLDGFVPDVILLDVLLTGEDGRNICKSLRENERTKDIPVILMSASPKLLLDYESCGAVEVITKPFHLSEIRDKIRSVLKVLPAVFFNFPEIHKIFHHL